MTWVTTDFTLANGSYTYIPLKRGLKGWDVFGLQVALLAAGFNLPAFGPDGYFGDETDGAVRRFQKQRFLVVDGIAGIVTQTSLVLAFLPAITSEARLPSGLLKGHVGYESGYQAGNHTALYEDGKRDLGLTQRHLEPTFDNKKTAFNGPQAVRYLALDPERGLRPRKNRYYPKVGTHEEAWRLAVASWNAPSVADAIAARQRGWPDYLASYVAHATAYVTDWSA
jgi:peptidoglycan hydrolase-like protein with peptidoglycan-binding domain